MASSDASALLLASQRVVFIGGLADGATESLVRASMIPFGNIKSVDVPMDYVSGKHRGFAFCEFEDPEDAEEAIFNMDGAELLGRVIKVSLAQPNQINKLSSGSGGGGIDDSHREAIWKSDEWFQQHSGGGIDEATRKDQELKQADAKVLQDL